MKWYEKQKQLYAQKNQVETPSPQQPEGVYAPTYEEPVIQQPVYEEEIQQNVEYTQPIVEEPVYEEEFINDQFDEMMDERMEQYVQEPVYASPNVHATMNYDATTISKGTLLKGNIETDGDLIIRGHIKGDVVCNANLSVYGIVEGVINCNNAFFDNAIIVGDVVCNGNLELTQSTTVDGNVEAYDLLNGGRIKGDATVAEGVRFLSTSAIVGNVDANDIEIERGAVIQGNVTIRQEVYFNGQ